MQQIFHSSRPKTGNWFNQLKIVFRVSISYLGSIRYFLTLSLSRLVCFFVIVMCGGLLVRQIKVLLLRL